MISDCGPRPAKSHYFRVCGWIRIQNIAIESATNNFSLMNNDSADRYFASVKRALSGPERFLHPEFVAVRRPTVVRLEHGFWQQNILFRCCCEMDVPIMISILRNPVSERKVCGSASHTAISRTCQAIPRNPLILINDGADFDPAPCLG